ncbi:glutamine synthetase, partial [[Eubacterium] rectale]|nr:glutamine synthetase [Agathobacter rectalis]
IPDDRKMGTRVEMRSVDCTANPYLAIAAILEAGLDGLRNNLTPMKEVTENIYMMTPEEREAKGIEDLPSSLHNALKSLRADEVVRESMGE